MSLYRKNSLPVHHHSSQRIPVRHSAVRLPAVLRPPAVPFLLLPPGLLSALQALLPLPHPSAASSSCQSRLPGNLLSPAALLLRSVHCQSVNYMYRSAWLYFSPGRIPPPACPYFPASVLQALPALFLHRLLCLQSPAVSLCRGPASSGRTL